MNTLPPDPWKALGVERNADKSEIRSAYKKLVLKCHPDKVQDATLKAQKQEEFQKVQQAYELLNDDAEKAKYEEQLKLAELQRAAKVHQAAMKNSPNTSVPRTFTKHYDIRTTETASSRYKSHSSPTSGKLYTHATSPHARSHEEMPSSRIYPLYEETERQARRAASYEKPSKREDERRERDRDERRRRKEEEEYTPSRSREKEREKELEREREREKERERERAEKQKERERETRRAEKKRAEKEREKERRRDLDDKARRHKAAYVEPYTDVYEQPWADDEMYVSSRPSEKKRSSSRKHDEPRDRDREREREKSSSRRAKSPHVVSVSTDEQVYEQAFAQAASYIERASGSAPSVSAYWKSQTPPDSFLAPPLVPTPPPADPEEESIRRSSARAAGRRSSNDAARSRDKPKYDIVDARPIPTLHKSHTAPPPVPESPPRVSRSHTTPHEPYGRPIPSLSRTQTWAASGAVADRRAADYYDDYESDDDRERRYRRSSRRTRSPGVERYKVEGGKTSKLEPHYSYGESPTSSRRYASADVFEPHSPSATYAGAPFKVKESKAYDLNDVSYSKYPTTYYSQSGHDGYPVVA